MEYKGKKIGFKRTVGAIADLSKIAPDGNIERMGEIFNEQNLGATIEGGAQFLAIMNKWYEKSCVFSEPGYVADPVPLDWFMNLEMDPFMELFNEAMKQFMDDDVPTVEAVDPKGKKNDQTVTGLN